MDEFAIVWEHRGTLLAGFGNTLLLSLLSGAGSLLLGILLAVPLMGRNRTAVRLATLYVDAMRCVPFLLFAYLIYFGLPSLGLRLNNWLAGLCALLLYNTGYMAELLRAAWAGLPKDTIDAGQAFGFHGHRLVRRIVLPQLLFAALPLIGNQLIQIVKDSAFLSIIAVAELTHEATAIQTTYFIPFASFVVAVGLYWLTCLAIEGVVAMVNRFAEARR